jgi:hypothetical protein
MNWKGCGLNLRYFPKIVSAQPTFEPFMAQTQVRRFNHMSQFARLYLFYADANLSNYNRNIGNKLFESMVELKYLAVVVTNHNYFCEGVNQV